MKKTLALFLALVMLAGMLAGCAKTPSEGPVSSETPAPGGNEPATTPDQPDVAYADTYKSTFSESITSMNPYCTCLLYTSPSPRD